MTNSLQKLFHAHCSLGLREDTADHAVVESLRLAELGHHAEGVLRVEDVKDLDNVGVRRQEGHDLGLILETLTVGRVCQEALVDDLAGEEIVPGRGEAAEDGAELAAADLLEQLVAALECFTHVCMWVFPRSLIDLLVVSLAVSSSVCSVSLLQGGEGFYGVLQFRGIFGLAEKVSCTTCMPVNIN